MHEQSTTSIGLLDAALRLAEAADPDGYSIFRNGLRFERSGDSMAVFDGECRIDRVNLREPSEYEFLVAIDMWLLSRYMSEVA